MKQRKVHKLFLRDGAECHICRLPVLVLVVRSGPASPTVDHVVPLSKGGAPGMGNSKLAHRYCNSVRGNAELTEELRAKIREMFQRKMGNLRGGIVQ